MVLSKWKSEPEYSNTPLDRAEHGVMISSVPAFETVSHRRRVSFPIRVQISPQLRAFSPLRL